MRSLLLLLRAAAENFDVEHCFAYPGQAAKCAPRGQLEVFEDEAKLVQKLDVEEEQQARQQVQELADADGLYVLKLHRPGMRPLQTSVTAQYLVKMMESRDYLDVELRDGLPIGVMYKVRADPLAQLFGDTFVKTRRVLPSPQVQISKGQSDHAANAGPPGTPGGSAPEGEQSIFRKYWYICLIVFVLFVSLLGEQ